jgi:hypothetical protein
LQVRSGWVVKLQRRHMEHIFDIGQKLASCAYSQIHMRATSLSRMRLAYHIC